MHPNSLKNLNIWQKGQSGNKNKIYTRLSDELRGIKALNQLEVNRLISKFARMTTKEMDIFVEDPKATTLEINICSIFQKSIKYGDFARLSFLLDRAIGKAQAAVDTEEDEDERLELQKLSMKELLTIVKNNLPGELEDEKC